MLPMMEGPREEKSTTELKVASTGRTKGSITTGKPGCASMKVLRALPPVTPISTAGMDVLVKPEGLSVVSVVGSQKMTPTAPAFCTLVTFTTKLQVPRSMSTKSPLSEPADSVLQAKESCETADTSRRGAVIGQNGCGASPNWPSIFWIVDGTPLPLTRTPETQVCELVVAPTAIAEGAWPGESTVFMVGNLTPVSPSLPPAATTSKPALVAFSMATASGSQGVVPVRPQAAPSSSGPESAGPPRESTA